ncbi:Zeaxanthin glucosyltransferase [Gemmata sp. SH-PL17]|uniref:glycosyltransferase n=1 Tax=Gemmata sp. SH-PL17 TaxID=1630693 RepID=UPI00078E9F36|nr:glycosyltransferase [Gemmata sp. SH-PL17]AMV23816.1 Zeaxanthin glucosyltransferase [Gemmata sp. SH-PL17]
MHLALVCPSMHGHLNPMATLGRELARRGHRISLIGSPESKPKADACGFEHLPIGVPEHESGEYTASRVRLSELKGIAALKLTGQLLRDAALTGLRDMPDAITKAGVDGILSDQVTPEGSAVAESHKLPFVMICNALAVHQEPAVPPPVLGWKHRSGLLGELRNRFGNTLLTMAAAPLVRVVNEYRDKHKLPRYSMGSNTTIGLAQIAQQPALFDFPRKQLPAHFHYTGPWHGPQRDSETAPFPWEKLNGRPLVYASLGTLQNRLHHVFAAILEACSTLDVQVALSLGRKDAVWDGPVPTNAIVVPFAPQLTLLDKASLLITHAGLNTALEGLSRGLPMLCIPVTNDQPGVARRVEWLGAGEILKPGSATAPRLHAALKRLLADPKYRAASERSRDQMKAVPGVARAADIVEEAFRTGKPVLR